MNNDQLIKRNNLKLFYSLTPNEKEKPWWILLLASILIVLARILIFY